MNQTATRRLRQMLIAACAIAMLSLLARTGEIVAGLRSERMAAVAYARGIRAQLAGQLGEAADAYREATHYAPQVVEFYQSLAEVEARRGRAEAAIAAYRTILAEYPYTYQANLYRELGLIELRAGRPAEARRDLQQAVSLDPADWLAYFLLGHASRRLGDADGARNAWLRVVKLNPGFQPAAVQLQLLDADQR